jgi:hypothetical protein
MQKTRKKNMIVITTTEGTYPWSSVTHIFRNGYLRHDKDRNALVFKT